MGLIERKKKTDQDFNENNDNFHCNFSNLHVITFKK